MQRIRVGVIVDNRRLARWQVNAVRGIASKYDLVLYSCTNTRPAPRRFRHALYYLLNLAAIRNRLTRLVPFPADVSVTLEARFESEYEGNWQVFPRSLLDRLADDRPALLVKFGMGLLKVPDAKGISTPILSYHHGNPQAFRGRPAGFYEMLHDAESVGQVVQLLSNELDAGAVAVSAETRIHRHSYRATLIEAFRISPLLLGRAIENVLAHRTTSIERGKVYRLPSTTQTIAFCAKLLRNLIRRLLYGAFVEKRWQVATTVSQTRVPADILTSFPSQEYWSIEPLPAGYSFIADPFFHPNGDGILVEGMSKSTGLGKIVHLSLGEARQLTQAPHHWSYPATISMGDVDFLLPEAAQSGPARLFRMTAGRLDPVEEFSIDGEPRLLDPTILQHEGRFYLFANRQEEGAGVLRLWSSENLAGHFNEHPSSPLRISPAGSRMAGNIIAADGSLWRFGQDFRADYGDGVLLFEIERLSASEYQESQKACLKFSEVHGPHTVNVREAQIIFDFYRNRISLLAGVRRLRARHSPAA